MQDEQHDILKLMRTTGFEFDRTLALGALLEGEAVNVQLRYTLGRSRVLAGLSPYGTLRKHARAHAEEIRQRWIRAMPDIPVNLIRAQAFVYDEGVLFVERLRRRKRNWAWVDAAYRMPPRSTAQVLHPETYIQGEWPVEINLKSSRPFAPGYELVSKNTLGEFGMRLFLVTHLPKLEHPEKVVEGWRGDRVFLYRRENSAHFLVWISTWEDLQKAGQMAELLQEALKNCRRRVPWFQGAKAGAFKKGRLEVDVVAFIADEAALRHMVHLRFDKKTTEGRPFGDEEEKAVQE